MSDQFLQKTIEDLQLTGRAKIYYNFESYSGNYINSVSHGDPEYSGQIINYDSNFTGQSSGSGFFDGQYISIQNTEQITSEAATIIFSHKKTGVSNGVIYGDLDGHGPSGWEIGINDANKLYFKNYINGSPNYVMLESYLSDQNLCALSLSENGHGKLYRLNYEKPIEKSTLNQFIQDDNPERDIQYYDFDSVEFNHLPHTISNGNDWRVGSGEFLYQGYLDKFLYFDIDLNEYQLEKLCLGMYGDYSIQPAVSGVISGSITGYEIIESGVSGEVGNPSIATGTGYRSGYYTYTSGVPQTGCVEISGFVYIPKTGVSLNEDAGQETIYKKVYNLTKTFNIEGNVEVTGLSNYYSSGNYWNFSGNSGTFYGDSAIGPTDTIFGITGFETVTLTGYFSGYENELLTTGVNSGIVYNIYTNSGLYSSDEYYQISGERFIFSDYPNPEYYANAISLIDESTEEYFYDVVYDASEDTELNQISKSWRDPKYNKLLPVLKKQLNNHEINFAINGVSQMTGDLTFEKDHFNFNTYDVSNGYYTSGGYVYTKDKIENNDILIYDITPSGDKEFLEVSDLNEYNNIPFANFDFHEKDVFLNGVKQYSGIDYIDNGGFYPINNAVQTTGIYFAYPKYSGAYSFTGYGNTGITVKHNAINPNSYCAFYNGIRQPKNNIIAHSEKSDLITGTSINYINKLIYYMINGNTREIL